ncbi:hypothetical protein MUK42_08089, partial [Musa troglodytarum]
EERFDGGALSDHEKGRLDGQWRSVRAVSPLYRPFLVDAAALCMMLREPGREECKRHQGCPVMWWFKKCTTTTIHPSFLLLGSLSLSLSHLLLSALEDTSLFPVALELMGEERDNRCLPWHQAGR